MLSKNFNLFGFSILYNLSFFMPKSIQSFVKLGKYYDTSLVLVSSFYGIEPAISLPPNFKMIGSTFNQ